MGSVIVVAPHADDEVLGCGATIAKHVSRGDSVRVIVMTDASQGAPELYSSDMVKSVREEAAEAHAILGVHDVIFFDFPAPALNAYPEYRMSLSLAKAFGDFEPNAIYLPHPGDLHQDHAAVYRAALVAARPQGQLKKVSIYCYETLSETEWGPRQGDHCFVPNHFVDVTDHFSRKILAMSAFKSQIRDFPHPRSLEALQALATLRGATIGVPRAEAFEVERQVS
jgi:LmbE family N-acetylglucosaminyl deacetylase